jgi:DDE superfamily endonuclease
MFAEEARFWRMNRIRPCWAPDRHRGRRSPPNSSANTYGVVSPKNGCVYLIMPASNTACFQVFLDVLARRLARQDILLVLDGAPNHRCSDLAVPNNITLLYLPPYSPELNPKENLWDEIRELQELGPQIHGRCPRQAQAGCPLYRAQSKACPLHQLPCPISSTHSDVELV